MLGTLGASLLGNLLAGKGIATAGSGNKKGKEIVRAGPGPPLSSASQKNGIFNVASSFHKFWNKKVLSKWIKI